MNRKIFYKRLILGAIGFIFIVALGLPYQNAISEEIVPVTQNQGTDATGSIQTNEDGDEIPKELSEEEYQRENEELRELPEGYIVLYDLEDPEGIDPDLLPVNIAAMVDGDTKIVAYRETARIDSVKESEESLPLDPFQPDSLEPFYHGSIIEIPWLSFDTDNH